MFKIKRNQSIYIIDNKIFINKKDCLKHEKKEKINNIIFLLFMITSTIIFAPKIYEQHKNLVKAIEISKLHNIHE